MRNRGLYGQAEGNETRSAADSMAERIADNELIEGEHVASLRRMIQGKDWKNLDLKVKALYKMGFDGKRVDSMVTRAYSGVRL